MRKVGSGAPRTVLATDLDGTFLGGSAAQRTTLYDWIAQRRDEIVLIFVSGRGIDFMRGLADELPVQPDHMVGDVGTSVACGPAYEPLPHLEQWLDANWPADAHARRYALLRRQPMAQEQAIVRVGQARFQRFSRRDGFGRLAHKLLARGPRSGVTTATGRSCIGVLHSRKEPHACVRRSDKISEPDTL